MEKETKQVKKFKLGKVQKIIIASVAAVLCIAIVVAVVLYTSLHPLEKFALKIAQKQSFQMEVIVSGIPLIGRLSLTYEVDGNIQHIPAGNLISESYIETVGDVQYTYGKDANGHWTKSEGGDSFLGDLENNETLKQLLNVDNYEPVEGEENVYRQKADVTFDGFKNVKITLDGDKCALEMVILSNGMSLDALIVISEVGKIDLTLPVIE